MTARAWLHRSRWSLLAFAIAVPVAIVGTFTVGWFQYLERTTPHPRIVAVGKTVTDSRATFTLVDHEVIEADSDAGRELGALDGTAVIITTLHVDATGVKASQHPSCDFELVAPGPGAERHWGSDQFEVSLPYGGDEYETLCLLSDQKAFTLKLAFVVPADAADEVSLRLTTGGFAAQPALQWDW